MALMMITFLSVLSGGVVLFAGYDRYAYWVSLVIMFVLVGLWRTMKSSSSTIK